MTYVRCTMRIFVCVMMFTLAGCATTPRNGVRIPVTLGVNFGPSSGKDIYESQHFVDPGSTPKDVVSVAFPIRSDATCCNTREVAEIDLVRSDPASNRWWTCQINGSKADVSPYRSVLKSGDHVEWIYVEQLQ